MHHWPFFRSLPPSLSILLSLLPLTLSAAPFDPIERILTDQCAKCHGNGATLSNFNLATRASAIQGGKHGPAIVPGNAKASRLYQWVSEGKMPPGQKLDAASLKAIETWIDTGAAWGTRENLFAKTPARQFWAFQPPRKTTPPALSPNPIDAFLRAKLQEKSLDFNPPADHRTLIRRLAFDLTGLPPTNDDYQLTYPQAIDKMLASPRYAERWARHWLDVVRFGETDGGEHNFERFNAWPYRDWVIESLHADKPYNQFIREQIAGDLLAPQDPKMVAATGFLVAGPWDQVSAVLNKDETLRLQARMDELDDMVTTTAHSFLALTVNCARCHDHKFDPIPTRDYYRMTAFFSAVAFGEREVGPDAVRQQRDAYLAPLRKQIDQARKQLAAIEDPVRTRMLLTRYQDFDQARIKEPRRIPINPIFNRNQFAPVQAKHFRLVILNQSGKNTPRLDSFELLPAAHRISNWQGAEPATADKPQILTITLDAPQTVNGIRFSTDAKRGIKDGAITTYLFETSTEGTTWRELCKSLDHVGGNELDLPTVSDEELTAALTPNARQQRQQLQTQLQHLQTQIEAAPAIAKIYAAKPKELEKAYLLERGNVKRQTEELTPGILSAVGGEFPTIDSSDPAARRIALANWIASPKNPLTARVIVNRLWYHHFGNGIVNTPSDFGVNGDRPSHPELLDWLAVDFMENGWSLKRLHRQILLTQAYQQSGALNEKAFAVDAGNRLLWRMPLKRMDAETLRDTVLAATGNLNLKMGGPSYFLQQKGSRGSYIYKALDNDGPEVWRRAVYRFVVRGGERIMMDSFDCPDPSVATPQRANSNTPVQALTLMNNPFVIKQAGLLATRLATESPNNPSAQIQHAYQILYGRDPSPTESARDQRFLQTQTLAAWTRALFNSNEFLYVP